MKKMNRVSKLRNSVSAAVIGGFIVCMVAPLSAHANDEIETDLANVPERVAGVNALEKTSKNFKVLKTYCRKPKATNKEMHIRQLVELRDIAKKHIKFTGELQEEIKRYRNTPAAADSMGFIAQLDRMHAQANRIEALLTSKIQKVKGANEEDCRTREERARDAVFSDKQNEIPAEFLKELGIRDANYVDVTIPELPDAGFLCSQKEYDDLIELVEAEYWKAYKNSSTATFRHIDIQEALGNSILDTSSGADATTAILEKMEIPARADKEKWQAIKKELSALLDAAEALKVIDCSKNDEYADAAGDSTVDGNVTRPEYVDVIVPESLPEGPLCEGAERNFLLRGLREQQSAADNNIRLAVDFMSDVTAAQLPLISDDSDQAASQLEALLELEKQAEQDLEKWEGVSTELEGLYNEAKELEVKECDPEDEVGYNGTGELGEELAYDPEFIKSALRPVMLDDKGTLSSGVESPSTESASSDDYEDEPADAVVDEGHIMDQQRVDQAVSQALGVASGNSPYANAGLNQSPVLGFPNPGLDVLYAAEHAVDQRQQDVLRNQALEKCDDPEPATDQYPQTHKSATTTLAETVNNEQAETVTTEEPKETETVEAQPVEDKPAETAIDTATVPDQTATPKMDAPKTETVLTEQPAATDTVVTTVKTPAVVTETVKPETPVLPAEPVETVIVDTKVNQPVVVNNPVNPNTRTAGTPVVMTPKETPVVTTPIAVDKTLPTTRDAGLNTAFNPTVDSMTETKGNPFDVRTVDVARTPQTEAVSDKFNPLNLGVGNRTDVEVVDTETAKNVNPNPLPTRTIDLNVETPKVETAQPVTAVAKPTVTTPNFGKVTTTDIGVKTQDDDPAPVKLNTNGLSKGGLQTNQLSSRNQVLSTPSGPEGKLDVRINN